MYLVIAGHGGILLRIIKNIIPIFRHGPLPVPFCQKGILPSLLSLLVFPTATHTLLACSGLLRLVTRRLITRRIVQVWCAVCPVHVRCRFYIHLACSGNNSPVNIMILVPWYNCRIFDYDMSFTPLTIMCISFILFWK